LPRKKSSDESWHDKAFLRRVLKLEDIQTPDGKPLSAGGWIIEKPLPQKPNIEFLRAAHEACIASIDFNSLELPFCPSFIGAPQHVQEYGMDIDKRLKETKKYLEKAFSRLWEICQLVAWVTTNDAIKEHKDFVASIEPNSINSFTDFLDAVQRFNKKRGIEPRCQLIKDDDKPFATLLKEIAEEHHEKARNALKQNVKRPLPPMGPEDPF